MRTLMRLLPLCAAVSLCLLTSGCAWNAFGDHQTPDATPPAPPSRPCDLPYPTKPGDLPPQADTSKPLDGGDYFADVVRPDYDDRNRIAKEGAANIDWAQNHCVAGAPPKPSSTKPPD